MKSSLRAHLRAVARIARWEASHTVGTVDRRTAVVGAVVLLVSAGVLAGAAAVGGSAAPEQGIYRVGVDDASPYGDVVADSVSLTARPPDVEALRSGDVDVLVLDDDAGDREARILTTESPKSQAALSALRSAVRRHNGLLMARQENGTAAFPVVVTLRYESRTAPSVTAGDVAGGGGGGGGNDGGIDGGGSDGGTDGDGSTAGGDGLGGGSTGGGLGSLGGLFATETTGSPADIRPPFPFSSLLLAFAFLVPTNFIVQSYGSTILDERINRRGELLLVAPVTRLDIVAGKTLPYAGAVLAAIAAIALAVGGGPVSVFAVFPIALLMLSATFVGAMFARSFKELTFVTVTVSVFVTSYAFVPAIFTNVTPIALISPLSLAVRDLQGTGVSAVEFAFSTGPVFAAACVFFLLGAGVYREEDMFTQRPVPLKFLDALDARLSGRWSVALLSAIFIPFVFIAELLAVAVLFALPVDVSVPLLLVTIAAVEEVAKTVHVLAGFEHGRFARTARSALTLGALSGLGFFVGEKAMVVVQAVGIPDLVVGRAAFATAGVGVGPGLAVALLFAPLVLHGVTASMSALGATRDWRWWVGSLAAATVVHAAYNLTVVSALG